MAYLRIRKEIHMAASAAESLKTAVKAMVDRRNQCLAEIAQIDKTFADLGIKPGKARRGPGRPKGSTTKKKASGKKKAVKKAPKKAKRTRRTFAVSGEASILAMVKARKNPTTAEINKHWSGEGRSNKADNTLSKLVKAGKLPPVDDAKVRGSRYKVK